jgi:hypothetical protein
MDASISSSPYLFDVEYDSDLERKKTALKAISNGTVGEKETFLSTELEQRIERLRETTLISKALSHFQRNSLKNKGLLSSYPSSFLPFSFFLSNIKPL